MPLSAGSTDRSSPVTLTTRWLTNLVLALGAGLLGCALVTWVSGLSAEYTWHAESVDLKFQLERCQVQYRGLLDRTGKKGGH